jgi:hypothetical protein
MHPAHIRTASNLGLWMFASLILGGLLAAGLVWSMVQ